MYYAPKSPNCQLDQRIKLMSVVAAVLKGSRGSSYGWETVEEEMTDVSCMVYTS